MFHKGPMFILIFTSFVCLSLIEARVSPFIANNNTGNVYDLSSNYKVPTVDDMAEIWLQSQFDQNLKPTHDNDDEQGENDFIEKFQVSRDSFQVGKNYMVKIYCVISKEGKNCMEVGMKPEIEDHPVKIRIRSSPRMIKKQLVYEKDQMKADNEVRIPITKTFVLKEKSKQINGIEELKRKKRVPVKTESEDESDSSPEPAKRIETIIDYSSKDYEETNGDDHETVLSKDNTDHDDDDGSSTYSGELKRKKRVPVKRKFDDESHEEDNDDDHETVASRDDADHDHDDDSSYSEELNRKKRVPVKREFGDESDDVVSRDDADHGDDDDSSIYSEELKRKKRVPIKKEFEDESEDESNEDEHEAVVTKDDADHDDDSSTSEEFRKKKRVSDDSAFDDENESAEVDSDSDPEDGVKHRARDEGDDHSDDSEGQIASKESEVSEVSDPSSKSEDVDETKSDISEVSKSLSSEDVNGSHGFRRRKREVDEEDDTEFGDFGESDEYGGGKSNGAEFVHNQSSDEDKVPFEDGEELEEDKVPFEDGEELEEDKVPFEDSEEHDDDHEEDNSDLEKHHEVEPFDSNPSHSVEAHLSGGDETNWYSCRLPNKAKNAEILCKKWNTAISCNLYCAFGFRFPEGIRRSTHCKFNEGKWSKKFSECQPFLDCTAQLTEAGSLFCKTNKLKSGTECEISCNSYGKKGPVSKKTYTCNSSGRWSPELPHCVESEGIDVLEPPRGLSEHTSIEYPAKYPE